MSGGWTPSLHLFSHTKGTLHWDAEAEVYLPGERSRGLPHRRCGARALGHCAGARGRGQGRGGSGARTGAQCGCRHLRGDGGPDRDGRVSQGVADRPESGPGEGVHRLPERCDRQGYPARGARGHALDRACEALHHQRHGDRSGQDVEHERADHRLGCAGQGGAAGRADHVPAALHADDLRGLCRLSQGRAFRGDAQDADRRLGRGERRGVRAGGAVAAGLVFSEGRGGYGASRAARMPGHAGVLGHVRRLDAGQDRGRRDPMRSSS